MRAHLREHGRRAYIGHHAWLFGPVCHHVEDIGHVFARPHRHFLVRVRLRSSGRDSLFGPGGSAGGDGPNSADQSVRAAILRQETHGAGQGRGRHRGAIR